MTRKRVLLVTASAIASALVVTILLGRMNWRDNYGLAMKGVSTPGLITAVEPQNHMSIRYSYVVGSETFVGLESVGSSTRSLKVGDSVPIVYYPDDPALSCFCDPRYKLKSETGVILLAALATSIVVTFVLIRRLRSP